MAVDVARFRQLALQFPDAGEGAHHGHPDFRVHGRIFASLQPERGSGMVKVPLEVQRALLAAAHGAFTAASGAWGRAGCTMVELSKVPLGELRDALAEAFQFAGAAAKAPRAKRARPRRGNA